MTQIQMSAPSANRTHYLHARDRELDDECDTAPNGNQQSTGDGSTGGTSDQTGDTHGNGNGGKE